VPDRKVPDQYQGRRSKRGLWEDHPEPPTRAEAPTPGPGGWPGVVPDGVRLIHVHVARAQGPGRLHPQPHARPPAWGPWWRSHRGGHQTR